LGLLIKYDESLGGGELVEPGGWVLAHWSQEFLWAVQCMSLITSLMFSEGRANRYSSKQYRLIALEKSKKKEITNSQDSVARHLSARCHESKK